MHDTSGGTSRPRLLVFDVNETLSDMAPMARRFEDVGAPGHLAKTWFSGLLRDGFALTVAGVNGAFSSLAAESLRTTMEQQPLTRGLDEAVDHVMAGIPELGVHADVPDGVRALAALDLRLVTLSNGSSSVARKLLGDAGLLDHFDELLSVADAGIWKPAAGAYAWALDRCGVRPEEAMLVASHPWDTDGASRAGMRSAWVDRAGGSYPGYFRAPDLEVASLVDLAERLA